MLTRYHNIGVSLETKLQTYWAVGAVPDFDVKFAYIIFPLKGFPV